MVISPREHMWLREHEESVALINYGERSEGIACYIFGPYSVSSPHIFLACSESASGKVPHRMGRLFLDFGRCNLANTRHQGY
jgi:hypothetical protein